LRAPVLKKTPLYEVASVSLLRNVVYVAPVQTKQKIFSKAGPDRHTSTIFFVVWKSSAGIFPRTPYSALVPTLLSSAALVTAAQTVQRIAQALWTG
jgi:hypothetical protein